MVPEQGGDLLVGSVVTVLVVDREDELTSAVEVATAGRTKVHPVVAEDAEDIDEAALVGHGAGTRAP